MLRRTPLRPKSKYKPVALKEFHTWVAQHGCLVCEGPAEIHHVTGYADKPGRFGRDDWLVTPLCPSHHRDDKKSRFPTSVQGLTHQGFFDEYGIDLRAEAMRFAERFQKDEAA